MDNQGLFITNAFSFNNYLLSENNKRPPKVTIGKLHEKYEIIKKQSESFNMANINKNNSHDLLIHNKYAKMDLLQRQKQNLIIENNNKINKTNILNDNNNNNNTIATTNSNKNSLEHSNSTNTSPNNEYIYKSFKSKKSFGFKHYSQINTNIDLKRFQDILFAQKLKQPNKNGLSSTSNSSSTNLNASSCDDSSSNSSSNNSKKLTRQLSNENFSRRRRPSVSNFQSNSAQFSNAQIIKFETLLTASSVIKKMSSNSTNNLDRLTNNENTNSSSLESSSHLPPLNKSQTPGKIKLFNKSISNYETKTIKHFSSSIDGTKLIDSPKVKPTNTISKNLISSTLSSQNSTTTNTPISQLNITTGNINNNNNNQFHETIRNNLNTAGSFKNSTETDKVKKLIKNLPNLVTIDSMVSNINTSATTTTTAPPLVNVDTTNIKLLPLNQNAIKKLRKMLKLDDFVRLQKSTSNSTTNNNKKEIDFSNVCHDTNTLRTNTTNSSQQGLTPPILVSEKSDFALKKSISKPSTVNTKKKSINSPPISSSETKNKIKKSFSTCDDTMVKITSIGMNNLNNKKDLNEGDQEEDDDDDQFEIKVSFSDRSLVPPPSPCSDMSHQAHNHTCYMCEREAEFIRQQIAEMEEKISKNGNENESNQELNC